MRAASPLPDWQRTFALVGDTHLGTDEGTARWPVALAGMLQFSDCRYSFQVGDVVEIAPTSGYDEEARAAMLAMPGTVRHVIGNHDTVGVAANTPRSGTDAALGLNINPSGAKDWLLDMDFGVRMIGLSPEAVGNPITLDATSLEFLSDAAGDTELPCCVMAHAPLSETVGHGDPTTGPDAVFSSDEEVMQIHDDEDVRAALDAHANIIAYLNGHTHSPMEATQFVTLENVGTRSIACVNASATYYTGRTKEPTDPIRTFYVTITEALDVEVRAHDHRVNAWLTWPDGTRVQTVTPT